MNLEDFFPYDSYRTGQRELANAVYKACLSKGRLVVEAMSGFGKTSAVLSGALLAAYENDLRIAYLCRTKRQVLRVAEELSAIRKRRSIPSASLFSKFDYCLLRKGNPQITSEVFNWYCSFHTTNNLCSYFLNSALRRLTTDDLSKNLSDSLLSARFLLERGEQTHICPYEILRRTIGSARIIATTYHYLFEETSKSLLISESQLEPDRTITIVDEAHNLRDFIRDASSATISFAQMERSIGDSKTYFFRSLSASLYRVTQRTKEFCRMTQGWRLDKEAFVAYITHGSDQSWLPNLVLEATACADVAWSSISAGKSFPLSVLRMGKFLGGLLDSVGDESKILTRSTFDLTIVNADPSRIFHSSTKGYRALIFVSATVNPPNLFLRSLGLDPQGVDFHIAESSKLLRIKTLVDSGVTTKFKSRTTEMYDKIAQRISAVLQSSTCGVGIFAPSYAVLENLQQRIGKGSAARRVFAERRTLRNDEAANIMHDFKSNPGSVLLGVQGGRFSEGEDFREDQMAISIVVGLALPPPTPTLYAQHAYLKETDPDSSYLLISLLPALRKAFQSAGRHVRDPNKRGIVMLLDSRFSNKRIIDLMPSWLKHDLTVGDFVPERICEMVGKLETHV